MLLIFAFNIPLAEFTCMLWVIILHEYKSLSHKSYSRWNCRKLLYTVIAGLIRFALHLVQIPDFTISKSPHIITKPPPCFMVGVTLGTAALSPTLHHTEILLFEPKISNFDLSVQRILFHCSIVHSLHALVY